MTMTDLDGIVDDYLSRLDAALRRLPTSQRSQIVAEVSEHVSAGRTALETQDERSLRLLLVRTGDPNEIAAAALLDAPLATSRRRTFARRNGRRVVLIGVVILLVAAGAIAYAAQSGTSTVVMPNVVGKSANLAEAVLGTDGVQHYNLVSAPSVRQPAGTVFKTTPSAGVVVKPGDVTAIFISTGPSFVPRLVGLSQSQAMSLLSKEGLRWAVARAYRPDSNGVVVSQSPPRGVSLEKQTYVLIVVASSSIVVPREAPYLVSMPQQMAFEVLRSFGFKVRVRYFGYGSHPFSELRSLPGIVDAEAPLNVPATAAGVYIAVVPPHNL
jgi:hypothetical protein